MNDMKMWQPHLKSDEAGFTLVELAVVVLIAGIIIATAMTATKPYIEYTQYNTTQRKMDGIADALALYAQSHNRLPCPAQPNPGVGAEPLGAPRNSGTDGTNLDEDCSPDTIGMVPWRALGLDEEQAQDAFGNVITYAVSPVLAGVTTGGGGVDTVHDMCRKRDIWIQSGANLNPNKARFCCPRRLTGANEALEVIDENGELIYVVQQDVAGAAYGDLDVDEVNSPDIGSAIIAFVLVSHGRNGDGAYALRSDFSIPVTGPVASFEVENRDGDRVFRRAPRSRVAGNNFYDDVIVWRTNHQLYSAFGNDTCMRP